MVTIEESEIFTHDAADRAMCQLAVEAASESRTVLQLSSVESPLPIGKAATDKVLRGLAQISLQEPGYDYHGVTQNQAYKTITRLSGDIEYFFYPILAEAER